MIDIVLPWLDFKDINWQKSFVHYKKKVENIEIDLNDFSRYRDYGTLKFWFRMIDLNMPWVNKIHLVTADGQVPEFLNDNDKINIVHHNEFIDQKYLPTFNSSAIMINIHKIPNLAEKFILFNDDMFIMNPIKSSFFFDEENLPCDSQILSPIFPGTDGFSHIILNNLSIINKHFEKKNLNKLINLKYSFADIIRNITNLPLNFIPGYYDYHLPTAYTISEFEKVWEMERTILESTSSNKFRKATDVTEWLVRYWRLSENKFSPVNYRKLGKLYELNDVNQFIKDVEDSNLIAACINDSNDTLDYEQRIAELNQFFQAKFPNKCRFEV